MAGGHKVTGVQQLQPRSYGWTGKSRPLGTFDGDEREFKERLESMHMNRVRKDR